MPENARTCRLILYMVCVSFPNHLNTIRSYLFHFIQLRCDINPFNQSSLFTIPILINFLQLKYQGDGHSTPFETHPKTMWIAVSSSVVYYLAYDVLQLQSLPLLRFPVVAHHFLVWAGYVSVVSLTSVLLPDFVGRFLYLFFIFLSAIEVMYWLCRKLVMEEEENGDFEAHRRWLSRLLINSSGQRRQMLPR